LQEFSVIFRIFCGVFRNFKNILRVLDFFTAARSSLEFLGVFRSFESILEVLKLKSPRNFKFLRNFQEFFGLFRKF
jgi:hypothetical protein